MIKDLKIGDKFWTVNARTLKVEEHVCNSIWKREGVDGKEDSIETRTKRQDSKREKSFVRKLCLEEKESYQRLEALLDKRLSETKWKITELTLSEKELDNPDSDGWWKGVCSAGGCVLIKILDSVREMHSEDNFTGVGVKWTKVM